MTQRPQTYWQKRFEILEQRSNLRSQSHISGLAKQYRAAIRETKKDLAVFYNRLAANNDLPSIAAAKKLLAADELADFKMSLATYTRLAKENGITGDWTKLLENASLKHRISRLEAIKLQLEHHATLLMRQELTGLEAFAGSAYEAAYYNGAFEIAKGTGVGKTLFRLDNKTINTVIHKPWAADGRNFSARVWGQHRPQLVQNLHRDLTRSLMRGEGPDKAIAAISHDFDVSLNAAARLVQTEEAYFSSVAQRDVFNDLDVEQYEIIATLDSHTSDICQDLDGKVFKMSEFEAGVTAPPFHVRCRTTTAPYFDDEVDATRAARDPETGQTVQVPAGMKYQDWKNKFVAEPGNNTGQANFADVEVKAEAKPEKQEFIPAKTLKEASERIAYTGAQPFIGKISLDAANAVGEKYWQVVDKFPQLKGKFGIVTDASMGLKKNVYAAATVEARPSMYVNSRHFNKNISAIKSYEDDVAAGFHPQGTNWKSIFTHEIGHQASNIIFSDEFPGFVHEVKGVTEFCNDVMRWTLQRAGTSNVAGELSVYATKNSREFFAEAFSEYMDSPNPRPIAKAFGEVLQEKIKKVYEK